MTVTPLTTTPDVTPVQLSAAAVAKKRLSSPWASLAAIVIAVLWTLPTFGLLLSSFRPELAIKRTGWWTFFTDPEVTLDNYRAVFDSETGISLGTYFVNSLMICIPSVLIPLSLAALAAYAFAWVNFRGKNILFIAVFALQIVPLQVTLIPLLTIFGKVGIAGTFWPLWLAHTTFALPLAIYLLHNFMREIPSGLIEAARVDGAGHVAIFFKVMLPLLAPALAAFGIFQFLWVWNDLLVALVFAGGGDAVAPITLQLANITGTRGTAWHLLASGTFVSIIVPVTVFLLLQRYFVRGLLAGSVKG
ncbi:alpha-glucoside transport system permease protein [Actinoplanes octamycinicus]|uniref:Alpha-glucoside transport system permease protein n=1 Tax=Actinoplanes octamycinicus TaxID=135948 RepID=A0A7W7GYQ7_9ACTN|nr:carbohydrate ABC transporter permease [Actinoplanes octamycinicus]MBB4740751.1 alpha-glucoside transport system permease protein [Actinoplanes octamycinicus]GIE61711.1 sugar ABC transporter permease [Actinoplanes octamycinicus]